MEKGHCLCKKEVIPGGLKILKAVSLTQYHPDPVGYAMEEKENIPGGWNIQWKANNTKCYSRSVERTR